MKHNTLIRLGRTIVLGLAVAAAIPITSAAGASTGQFAQPPGATAESVAAPTGQFAQPPGATAESVAAPTGQVAQPPGATAEPAAGSSGQVGGVQVAPVPSNPVVGIGGGFDWGDAGIGAAIAFAGMLLLGSALLVLGRRGQRDRLATH
jgi:hypothetical protein